LNVTTPEPFAAFGLSCITSVLLASVAPHAVGPQTPGVNFAPLQECSDVALKTPRVPFSSLALASLWATRKPPPFFPLPLVY
jgi:hypothetical protein